MLRLQACLRPSARAFNFHLSPDLPYHDFRISQLHLVFIRGSKYKAERPKRNLEIPHNIVYPINPLTGELESPAYLTDLVASIDTNTHCVQLISEDPHATVKILNFEEEADKKKEAKEQNREQRKATLEVKLQPIRQRHQLQQKAIQERRERMVESGTGQRLPVIPKPKILKKAKNNNTIETKEIQLAWGVAEADLEHKIKKVIEELEKDHRVNLVIAPKSRKPTPPRPEMEERIRDILDRIKDIGKEWQARTFERRTVIIRLQKLRS